MSFDIYGEQLSPGHCEVHPWVAMEYPCPVCLKDAEETQQEKNEYEKAMKEEEQKYYDELRGIEEYESWFR